MNCEHNFNAIDAYYTCVLCGIIDTTRPVYIDQFRVINNKNYHLYHRKIYFLEKLRLISGIKQSGSEQYHELIIKLGNETFTNLKELRKLIKQYNYNKFYKYIHSIYFDIKKVRLIKLSYSDIDFLLKKFLIIEREFKKQYNRKSNILSYNIIIYTLFNRYYPDYCQYLILPKNNKKICEKIIELLRDIDNY